jgi:hypothetical protein
LLVTPNACYLKLVAFNKESARYWGKKRWEGKTKAQRSAYMAAMASVPRTTKRRSPKMYMKLRLEVELLKRQVAELRELLSVKARLGEFDASHLE